MENLQREAPVPDKRYEDHPTHNELTAEQMAEAIRPYLKRIDDYEAKAKALREAGPATELFTRRVLPTDIRLRPSASTVLEYVPYGELYKERILDRPDTIDITEDHPTLDYYRKDDQPFIQASLINGKLGLHRFMFTESGQEKLQKARSDIPESGLDVTVTNEHLAGYYEGCAGEEFEGIEYVLAMMEIAALDKMTANPSLSDEERAFLVAHRKYIAFFNGEPGPEAASLLE